MPRGAYSGGIGMRGALTNTVGCYVGHNGRGDRSRVRRYGGVGNGPGRRLGHNSRGDRCRVRRYGGIGDGPGRRLGTTVGVTAVGYVRTAESVTGRGIGSGTTDWVSAVPKLGMQRWSLVPEFPLGRRRWRCSPQLTPTMPIGPQGRRPAPRGRCPPVPRSNGFHERFQALVH